MDARVGVLTIDLLMRQNASLKDRRRIVRSLLDRARVRHAVAVADLGPADNVRRATLAFACVGRSPTLLEKVLDDVRRSVESDGQAEVLNASVEVR